MPPPAGQSDPEDTDPEDVDPGDAAWNRAYQLNDQITAILSDDPTSSDEANWQEVLADSASELKKLARLLPEPDAKT